MRTDLEYYFQKSGDTEILDGPMEYVPDGWFTWGMDNEVFFIYNACGNGKNIMKRVRELSSEYKCTTIRCATRRRPDGFKKHGFKVIGYVLESEG